LWFWRTPFEEGIFVLRSLLFLVRDGVRPWPALCACLPCKVRRREPDAAYILGSMLKLPWERSRFSLPALHKENKRTLILFRYMWRFVARLKALAVQHPSTIFGVIAKT
jgi:hypothetical protein